MGLLSRGTRDGVTVRCIICVYPPEPVDSKYQRSSEVAGFPSFGHTQLIVRLSSNIIGGHVPLIQNKETNRLQ